ncbi:hypothetical protein PC9H_011708 [Pleurotus ostreatus]|uniref:DNA 3'-5' helicase n=1 Tax=Pleurotus ostreatus TaxID=5322 RepID=A0A8H6ZLK3_PLEOS|nr:uncharacterized protein PC9H_011708 [Pleurotus ostreatus]KAF7421188.1 hypothetical protein PC9H_011708 [Pleurotus ostreatus]
MSDSRRVWSIEAIRELTLKHFGKRPCLFQIQVAMAIYCDQKDVVACAPTGSGKTLSFWIPLIMAQADGLKKLMIVVTPLNLLGQQNVDDLASVCIRAIAINSENNSVSLWKDVKNHRFDVLIINPEILMSSSEATALLEDEKFASSILHIVFDEGHCISEWGKFRKDYTRLGALRHTIQSIERIPLYVASATLPESILVSIANTLQLRDERTRYILQSNDRPEVALLVRMLVYPANGYKDLEFLLPGKQYCDNPPDKFIIFFDNTKEAEAARDVLRKRLSTANKKRVKHFHSTMTQEYRQEEYERFRRGEVWGICSTDAFGMGMDLPDIQVVVQWRPTCGLNTLFQRFGRAVRERGRTAVAILLVDRKDMDETRSHRGSKRKATEAENDLPRKQVVLTGSGSVRNAVPVPQQANEDVGVEEAQVIVDGTGVNGASPVSMDPTECAKRYQRQARNGETQRGRGKGRTNDVGTPMDDFINSHVRGLACQRIIPSTFFGNDDRSKSLDTIAEPIRK